MSVADNRNPFIALVEQYFGLDQNLINGAQYYDRYEGCKGVPFFMSIGFMEGDITIKKRLYQDVRIRYDMLSQCVEVEYDFFYGGNSWLVAVTDHIEAFQIGEYHFMKLNLEGPPGKFYQVIRTKRFTCYVHWEKKLSPLQNDPFFTHEFSDPKPTCLLDMDGEINKFKNRKAFAEQFPEHLQKEIKNLFKRNQFKVQRASPNELLLNMNAVGNLLSSGGLP